MKVIEINSKKHGLKQVFVDDVDYDFLMQWKWCVHRNKRNKTFYVIRTIRIKKKSIRIGMHRLLMGLNDGDKRIVDHIDHNGLNNQKYNLRICTNKQNIQNKSSAKGSSSSYLGVQHKKIKRKNKKGELIIYNYYVTQLNDGKDRSFFKQFPFTPEGEIAAAKAYDEAAKKHYGEFANLNFK